MGNSPVYAQCVVARRPFSNPATPNTKAPVQTDVTYFALPACRRTKSIVSASAMAFETPNPPGTQRRSSGSHVANVVVGTRLRPQSLATGLSDLAAMWVRDSGSRCSTCKGPVKSSCVTLGKSTKPTLKAMGAPSGSVGPTGSVRGRLQRLALGDARDMEALEIAVALVEFEADPDEQVVEGVGAETERQAFDGLELTPPLPLEPRQVVLQEHDGGREDHAPALGQCALGQYRAIEVRHLARAPQVELHDREILAHVVVDISSRQHVVVQARAIDTAALFEQHRQPLAGCFGVRKILSEIKESELEPALTVKPVVGQHGRHARHGRPGRRGQHGIPCESSREVAEGPGHGERQDQPHRRCARQAHWLNLPHPCWRRDGPRRYPLGALEPTHW